VSRSVALAAALWLAWTGARADSFQGLPVAEIVFSPPAQPVPPARLVELIPLRAGQPLDPEAVRQSIQRMFQTGRYADIEVDAVRSGDGVRVTIITKANWFIGPVKFLNVPEPPSISRLRNAVKLDLGETYSEQKIAAAKEALRQLLADNGFYRAAIEVGTQAHSDTQQIDVTFLVDPGARARFGRITLTGTPDLTPDQTRRIAKWPPSARFTQPAVQRGLERLRRHYQHKSHLRAEIRLAEQRHAPPSNRVDLALVIHPGPRVEVAISGAKLSRKQLRRYLPIYEEGTVDRDLLVEGARNLRDYFQTHGYFDAKVDYAQHAEENSQILVEFQATLGPRHRFVKLEITGNRFFDVATLRERMYLQTGSLQAGRGRFSQSLLRSDMLTLQELYRSNGFLSAEITWRVDDDFAGKTGDMALFLSIHEGSPTLISSLQVSGNQAVPTEEFAARLSSIAGQSFSEANVAADRDQILGLYFSRGFPDAVMEWRFEPAGEPNQVRLEYQIQEGEQQFVRQVIVDGYQTTRQAVGHRQIKVYGSEPLSQAAMLDSQRRLYDLGIFSKVEMAVQNPEGVEAHRNLLFQVEEARRWTLGVGGGAEIARFGGSQASLENPAGETAFAPRVSLEISRLNMFGTAATLSFRSRLSTLQRRGLVTYQAPQWRGRERLTLTFSALYDTSRNVRTFTATRLEGALQLQHQISKPSTLFYRYSYRRVDVESGTLKIDPNQIPLVAQPVRVGLLSASWAQDRRDDPLDARRGVYSSLDLGLASSKFTGSEPNFSRLLAQNSTYHPLSKKVVLARTTQLGGLVTFGPLRRVDVPLPGGGGEPRFTRQVPLPERLFSGGSNSHRGFPVNQAGPRDLQTGFPLGGSGLLLNSVELRFPVRGDNIGGVLFHDAGNLYAKPKISFRLRQRDLEDFDYMVHAVGAGVRYRTPIGPIRLDLAYSANGPTFRGLRGTRDELLSGTARPTIQRISRLQFHFSLGQTF